MDNAEQALIHYDQSIALDSNWVDAWIGRGVVKDMQGRLPEAVKDLEYAVKLAPEHGDGWFYLANAYARSERYPEAFEAYIKLNAFEPENLDGWLDHSDLLLRMKGPDAAVKKLREGEQVHKLNSKYRYRMVSYLLRLGHQQQALLRIGGGVDGGPFRSYPITRTLPGGGPAARGDPFVGSLSPMNYTLSHIPARANNLARRGSPWSWTKVFRSGRPRTSSMPAATDADIVKLGFGTSFVTPNLKKKVDLYHKAGMKVYLGGTLFEAFVARGNSRTTAS
ncbi:MAG: phosphosulfolactate synthase [Flavobacteriales bacterium]